MTDLSILIVEDEPGIAESLRFGLERERFVVTHVESLAGARAALARDTVALIILDLGLPDGNGESLLRDLRRGEAAASLPVILLTSRDAEVDRILGLELGADDYVTKPFSPREVVARVKAVLRRGVRTGAGTGETEAPAVIERHGVSIDEARRRAWVAGREVSLTRTEHDLLAALWARPGRVLTRSQLLDLVWTDATVSDRTVDVHVKSLRRVLREAGADPTLIETVRGVGYRARE